MRSRSVATSAIVATIAGLAILSTPTSRPVSGHAMQVEPDVADGMRLVDQTFAVETGGTAHIELLVTGDVPEIATTTTTTTTTTTSTTTTTTTPPVEAEGSVATTTPTTGGEAAGGNDPPGSSSGTTTTTEPAGPEMVVHVRAHAAVRTRSAVTTVDSGTAGPVVDIVEYELADVGRHDEGSGDRFVALDIELADPPSEQTPPAEPDTDRPDILDVPGPGVYPITVQIRRDRQTVAQHTTFIEVLDDSRFGRGPLRFVMFAAVADPGPTPTDADIDAAREEVARIADAAAASSVPLSLSLPPTVVTALQERDPALVGRLTSALDAGDLLLSLPDYALDPSSAAAAGITDELTRRLVDGEQQLAAAFEGVSIARAGWAVDGPLSSDGARALRELGVPLLVVTEPRYSTYDGNIGGFVDTTLLSNAELPDESPIRMAIIDPISEWFDPTVDTSFSPVERAVRAMATASASREELPPDLRSMVIAASGLTAPDADTTREIEHFVAEHPDMSFDTLARLPSVTNILFVDQQPHTVELPDVVRVSLDGRVREADALRLRIADVESMMPTDDERPPAWQAELEFAMSTGLTRTEAQSVFAGVDAGIEAVRASVGDPESFPITIAGRSADIPVRIENASDTPLTVKIRVSAEKLSVPDGDVTTVLAPSSITETLVPVIARSNGVFPVTIEVLTPADNLVSNPIELPARVNNLTGMGRVVTVGAALVLISWWFSYFRNRRRRAAEQSADRHPSNGGPHPDATGAPDTNPA